MITYKVPKYNIEIGSHPVAGTTNGGTTISDYDVVLNVSDDPPYGDDRNSFEKHKTTINWFPINEFGYWTYQVLYWAARLFDAAMDEKKNVYVHCHAGMHRSPLITYLYVRSLGHTVDETFELFHDGLKILGEKSNSNWLEETLQNDIEYGRIPADAIQFMIDVRKNPGVSLMGIMKRRDVMDLPQKTIEKNGIKKPVGQTQIHKASQELF